MDREIRELSLSCQAETRQSQTGDHVHGSYWERLWERRHPSEKVEKPSTPAQIQERPPAPAQKEVNKE